MHLYDPKEYPNLLPLISLTSEEIRQIITPYRLEFSQERNREVEWGIKLPMFVEAFYNYVVVKQEIPTQKDFFDYYLFYNKDFFKNLDRPDLMPGIKARVFRTYPSLIRDIYFNKFIEEKIGSKSQVIYNTRLDIEEGIDLMITTSKNNYGICFFTKTRRAFDGRKVKEHRHTLFDNVKFVEMPMDFHGSVKAGAFFLYGDKEYKELYITLTK